MTEEILLKYSLNRDNLFRKGSDYEIIVRLDIEPSEEYRQMNKTVSCDICLVLDGSSSMDERFAEGQSITKRQGVMAAAGNIIPYLNDRDTVSLVFYDSRAYSIAQCIPAGRKEELYQKIESLDCYRGTTNFEAALKTAKAVLQKGENTSRRIIFFTDGCANEGSHENVNRISSEMASQGITIDGLGAGTDFNFHYMRNLSGPSNGRTFLLKTPEQACQQFEELLFSAQKTVANNVFITVFFPKGLRDIEAYQWLPEMRYYGVLNPGPDGQTRLEINAQTLRQDRRNIFFFKVNADPPCSENTRLLANVRLDCDLLPAGKSGIQEHLNIFAGFTDDENKTEYDTAVETGFYEAELSKLYEQFESLGDKDWQKALAVLEEMIKRADELGNSELKIIYEECREKLRQTHKLSNDDINRIGSMSTVSTQAQEGYLEDPDDFGILSRL